MLVIVVVRSQMARFAINIFGTVFIRWNKATDKITRVLPPTLNTNIKT